jgi:ribulose-bisphosphate carboxylase large chain
MNMLFGNCSLQPEVELVDVRFPAVYEKSFPGPRYGIEGIRTMTGVVGRPLTCTALKPQGSSVEFLAHLARTFALAGIDVIKDDHGIANQQCHPFEQRVTAVQKAINEANRETGGNTVYAPTFSGGGLSLREQARVANEHGVRKALVAPMLVGIPAFVEMQVDLASTGDGASGLRGRGAHRAAGAAGQALRLFGADATIFPEPRRALRLQPRAPCMAIARAAREPWADVRPTLPVPAAA